jgi:serine/threonine-protein kinase
MPKYVVHRGHYSIYSNATKGAFTEMPKVGDIVGQYLLVRLLGQGGMGEVYEAAHTRIKSKRAAVKFLLASLASNPEVITRFEREAEAAAAIGHEGIIDVYDLGQGPDGAPYLIMEFLDGKALTDSIEENDSTGLSKPQKVGLSVYIASSILSALAAAHEIGIVHRDLKPDNIFLIETGSGRPKIKLLDFGIARFIEQAGDRAQNTLTRTGAIMGTPYFMSPEQALGKKDAIDQRIDLWAMGVILYKILTGRYPFQGENYNQVLSQIISDYEPAEVSVLNPEVPEALEKIVHRAICKDLEKRYTSADEMLQDLRPLMDDADLGLLDHHVCRSPGSIHDTLAIIPDQGDSAVSDPVRIPTPLPPGQSYPGPNPTVAKSQRSLWLAVILTLVVVAILGVGGGAAALVWNSTQRGTSADESRIEPAPRPPIPAANLDPATPVSPTSSPVVSNPTVPGSEAPALAVPQATAPPASSDRQAESTARPASALPSVGVEAHEEPSPVPPPVAATQPPDAPTPHPPATPNSPDEHPDRSARSDRPRRPEPEQLQPPRVNPPPRPQNPTYGREIPASHPVVYGEEL